MHCRTTLKSHGMKMERASARAIHLLLLSQPLPCQPHSKPFNKRLLQDGDHTQPGHNGGPSRDTQVPAAELGTLSFNRHSCSDRCAATAPRSEKHTLCTTCPLQTIPNTIRTPSLNNGGVCVSIYDKLHSCLLLRAVSVRSKDFYYLGHGMKRKGKGGKSVS